MAGGDGGLQRVRASGASERLGPLKRLEASTDEEVVPSRAVLVEQEDGLSRRAGPGPRARGLDLHEREEPVDLRLVRDEPGQDSPEPERVLGERGPQPVVA